MNLFADKLRISPYSYSIFTALREKGIPFEWIDVEFADGETLTSAFKGKTFTDLIPAIEDGSFVLSESMAIIEYLEEKYPPPRYPALLPSKLEARAQARMLLSWYRCGLKTLRDERSTETLFYRDSQAKNLPPLSSTTLSEVGDWLRYLHSILKEGERYLFGTWSIADSETALMLQRLILNGYDVGPKLTRFANDIWERPAEKEFVTKARPPYRSFYI